MEGFIYAFRVVFSMVDAESLQSGERVFDKEISAYRVVEVLDKIASEVIAKEEVTDRGHTIYQEKTVADLNSSYPADDVVIRVERESDGRELLWPVSRVTDEVHTAIES